MIYYWHPAEETFYMLFAYPREAEEDLSPTQLKVLRKLGKGGTGMNPTDFKKLAASLKQAGKIRRGRLRPARVTQFHQADVRAIRKKLDVTQAEFALMIGVSLATLRNWERAGGSLRGPPGRCWVAAVNPKAVITALSA